MQLGENLGGRVRCEQVKEILQWVLLARLTEGQTIDCRASLVPFQPTKMEHGNAALYLDRTFINPIGNEFCIDLGFGAASNIVFQESSGIVEQMNRTD